MRALRLPGELQITIADFAPGQRHQPGLVGPRIRLADGLEHLDGLFKIGQRIVRVVEIPVHQRAAIGEQRLRVEIRRTIGIARQTV